MGQWPAQTFRVRDAIDVGLGREALRSESLEAPFHGVRFVGRVMEHDQLCRAYATKMPAWSAFSGPTAARIWELPLPNAVDGALVHVTAPYGRSRARGRRVRGHLHEERIVRMSTVRSLRTLSPVDTWCSLGGVLPVCDLVAVADRLVTGIPFESVLPLATLDDLDAAIALRPGAPGVADLRAARRWTRVGAWSRPESLLRYAAALAGLPEPELNARLGSTVLDLFWRGYGVGAEYDGDHHRDRAQHRADVLRHERLGDRSIRLVHVTADDLFDRTAETVVRIASRLGERGWVPRRRLLLERIPELGR